MPSNSLYVSPELKGLVQRQLEERKARQPGAPPRPVATVKCRALHDLQFRATVEGHSFISDEPEHGGGSDAAPAPLRYFLASVAMCHHVFCVKGAALRDLTLESLEGEIAGYLGTAPSEDPSSGLGFTRLTYTVRVQSAHSDDQIWSIVDEATRLCPAFVTVQRASTIELRLEHNGVTVRERTYGRSGSPI